MSSARQHKINGYPRFVYFAGVDGSGKSTVIDEILKEYAAKGIKAKKVWLRFNYFFTKPVLLFCRLTGITRREQRGDKTISVHDFHRSRTIAILVQYLHFVDTLFAFLLKVWFPLKFTSTAILCDKYVFDILADFMVETKDLSLLEKPITRLFLRLIPWHAQVIFFIAGKEEIIRRKPEVLMDDEDYDLKYRAYQAIHDHFSLNTIINDNLDDTLLKTRKIINP